MHKKYWAHYYRDFANTYRLYWTDCAEMKNNLPADAERITRKDAEHLAAAERARREIDGQFAGYADTAIYPADGTDYYGIERNYILRGYIWERRQ